MIPELFMVTIPPLTKPAFVQIFPKYLKSLEDNFPVLVLRACPGSPRLSPASWATKVVSTKLQEEFMHK
jgi:hypothetical protein